MAAELDLSEENNLLKVENEDLKAKINALQTGSNYDIDEPSEKVVVNELKEADQKEGEQEDGNRSVSEEKVPKTRKEKGRKEKKNETNLFAKVGQDILYKL